MPPDKLTDALSASGLAYADTDILATMPGVHTSVPGAAKPTAPAPSTAPTRLSSAEYVVTEIKRHKIGVAVAGLAIVLIAVAVYFYYPRPHVTALTDKDTILLADFLNTTGDPVFDGTLKQALAIQLGQSPFLDIFPEDRMRETLQFMERRPDERITRDVAREICERQGIKAMLVGSISALGSHYVVSLEALNAHTGETIANEQFETDGKEQVLKSLGETASRVREQLGESLSSIQKFDAPIEQVTTSSLEPLRYYSLGLVQHSSAKYLEAIPFYKHAIEVDPNFSIAYARLAACYNNTKQMESSRDSFKKAYELRDRASEREKLYISSNYYVGFAESWDKPLHVLAVPSLTYP